MHEILSYTTVAANNIQSWIALNKSIKKQTEQKAQTQTFVVDDETIYNVYCFSGVAGYPPQLLFIYINNLQ